MSKKKTLMCAALSLFSEYLCAGTIGPVVTPPQWVPVITATAGPDFVNPGQAQTLTLLPPFQNHYTKANTSQTVADVGGFIGVERVLTEKLSVQLGVSGYWDSQMTVKGDVWQFTLPEFDDLGYTYRIHHARVMAATKFLTTLSQYASVHPYVSGELGAAFNQASGYQETPLEIGAIPTPPFSNHSQTSLAWGVGAGIDYNLNQQIRLGLGYQFADLGKASLGQTTAELTNQSLSVAHLYANQLRFQLTILV
jgi:Outer membrane protein beta-barrel domain